MGRFGPPTTATHGSRVPVGSPLPGRAGPGALPQPVVPALIGAGSTALRDPARQPRRAVGDRGPDRRHGLRPSSPDPQVRRKPAAAPRSSLRAVAAPARSERRAPHVAVDRAVAFGKPARRAFVYAPGRVMRLRGTGTSPAAVPARLCGVGTAAVQRFTTRDPVTVRTTGVRGRLPGTSAALGRRPTSHADRERLPGLTGRIAPPTHRQGIGRQAAAAICARRHPQFAPAGSASPALAGGTEHGGGA